MPILRKIKECFFNPVTIPDHLFGRIPVYKRYRTLLEYNHLNSRRETTIKRIRETNSAHIVILAANLSMWRYQKLYEQLATDTRFKVTVVIIDLPSYTSEENQKNRIELKEFFDKKEVNYTQFEELPEGKRIDALEPDILFIIQPYAMKSAMVNYYHYKDKLLCYYPYALQNSNLKWEYNTRFHNIAWRIYLPTPSHVENAKALSYIKGRNCVVVGEPHSDEFFASLKFNPWNDTKGRKKIIWAPHFQITPNAMYYRPSFLWTYELMLDIAKKYSEQLYIAFKPHPRLYSTLCNHPEWGKAKTDAYYDQWKQMPNTQFENGEFVELFKSSDALMHDCGSFTSEYLYTKKPCLFLTQDEPYVRKDLCIFGNKCFDSHYIAKTKEDIIRFIEDIVITGNDTLNAQRQKFFDTELLPPNGKTTAENTYNDLVNSLFGE